MDSKRIVIMASEKAAFEALSYKLDTLENVLKNVPTGDKIEALEKELQALKAYVYSIHPVAGK